MHQEGRVLGIKCHPSSYQGLPVKRRKSVEKLDLHADMKEELSRDMYYYKVLTQREKFFEDPI